MMTGNYPAVRVGHLLSLVCGALFTLGFSPFDYWPLLLVATGGIYLLSQLESVKTAFVRGFLFGLGLFGAGTSWVYVSIHEFGAASVPLALLLTALFVVVLSLLMTVPVFCSFVYLKRRFCVENPWHRSLLFTGLWVMFEWVRSWILTGFPWLLQGYVLLDTPFQSLAPVLGVYGLSLLMVFTATQLATLWNARHNGVKPAVVSLVLVLLIGGGSLQLNSVEWTKPVGTIRFSAIQGNIPQAMKWDPSYVQTTFETYTRMSSSEWQQDLVVWPENAVPMLYSRARSFLETVDGIAKKGGSTLLLGMPYDDRSKKVFPQKYYNSVVVLGAGSGRYFKQKLVPFGEYVPLESVLRGLIDFFDLPMSAFSRGEKHQPVLSTSAAVIAPYICYEVVYPDFAARQARKSGLLVTFSNDTWFGRSVGPDQHFQMARMRSLETGRYMIRATNDGITALVDSRGKVVASAERYQAAVLRGNAVVVEGTTPFMSYGSLPVLVLALLLMLVAFRLGRQ